MNEQIMKMKTKKNSMINILFLGLVSFFTDISTEMVYPIIPLYLISVFGATPALVGVIEGIAESLASLLKVYSGYISDRFKRKKALAFAGYSTGIVYKLVLIVAGSWGGVLIARVIDRFGKGVRTTPRDVLVSESAEKSDMGKAFGLHKAFDMAGAALGILITYTLLRRGVSSEDYKGIFLVSLIPAVFGLCMFFFIKERRVERSGKNATELKAKNVAERNVENLTELKAKNVAERSVKNVAELKAKNVAERNVENVTELKAKNVAEFKAKNVVERNLERKRFAYSRFWKNVKRLDARLKLYLIVVLIFTLGNSSNAFLLLKAKAVGFDDISVILLYFTYNITAAALSFPIGRLSDKVGRKILLVTGYFVFSTVYFGFAFAWNQPFMISMFLVYGVYTAMITGVERAFIAEISPPELKGTMLGLQSTVAGIALLPASAITGILWDMFGVVVPFIYGATLSVCAALILLLFMHDNVADKTPKFLQEE